MLSKPWILALPALAACARNPQATRAPDASEIATFEVPVDWMGAGARRLLLDSVSRAHTRWKQSRPRAYELRVVERSACFAIHTRDSEPPSRPVYIVAADTIRGQRPVAIPDSLRRACWHRWTADSLFATAMATLHDSRAVLHEIVLDADWGIPRRIVATNTNHGPARITVDHFVVMVPK